MIYIMTDYQYEFDLLLYITGCQTPQLSLIALSKTIYIHSAVKGGTAVCVYTSELPLNELLQVRKVEWFSTGYKTHLRSCVNILAINLCAAVTTLPGVPELALFKMSLGNGHELEMPQPCWGALMLISKRSYRARMRATSCPL